MQALILAAGMGRRLGEFTADNTKCMLPVNGRRLTLRFKRYKKHAELGDVLSGRDPGRTSDFERILSYNIGLGLHDVLYAHKILELINGQ